MEKKFIIGLSVYVVICSLLLKDSRFVIVAVLLLISSLALYYLFIEKEIKKLHNKKEALEFMKVASHAYFYGKDDHFLNEAISNLSKDKQKLVADFDNNDAILKKLDEIFEFRPFSLFCDHMINCENKKYQLVKSLIKYGNHIINGEQEGEKYSQFNNILINVIQYDLIILCIHQFCLMVFDGVAKDNLLIIYVIFYIIQWFLMIIQYFALFKIDPKRESSDNFFIEYLIRVNFETAYLAFENSIHLLSNKDDKITSLKEVFNQEDSSSFFDLYRQSKDELNKEWLLFFYRLSYSNNLKKEEETECEDLFKKYLNKSRGNFNSKIKIWQLILFGLAIVVQYYLTVEYGM